MDTLMAVLHFCQQYSVVVMGIVFVLLIASVLWPGRGERFERDARIPLEDDR
jgi:cbb3-type cytochrome oxidase subunit 3